MGPKMVVSIYIYIYTSQTGTFKKLARSRVFLGPRLAEVVALEHKPGEAPQKRRKPETQKH